MVYSIYFIIIKNLSHSHYSDWYSHWDLVGTPIQNNHLFGCLSCPIEQWHIFRWSFLSGFWGSHPSIHSHLPPALPFPPTFLSSSKASTEAPAVSSPIQPLTWHAWCRRASWIHNGLQSLRWVFWRTNHHCLLRRHSNGLGPAEYRQSIPLVSLHEAVQHPPTR